MIGSFLSVDERINDLLLPEECTTIGRPGDTFHTMYKFATIAHQLSLSIELLYDALSRSESSDGFVNGSMVLHAHHLTTRHAFQKLETMERCVRELATTTADEYSRMVIVFFAASIARALFASDTMATSDVTVSEMCVGALKKQEKTNVDDQAYSLITKR
jgi:hypothetical protein